MAILKELRRYSSQKSIRGLSHSSTSRPFSTRNKIKLTGARANGVTHRRSQESLLTSTLESYFRGERELFEGLKIMHLEQDWEQYPVIRLDLSMAKGMDTPEDLRKKLLLILEDYADQYGRRDTEITPGGLLQGILKRAFKETGRQVVVLIDEYDAPLLEVLFPEWPNIMAVFSSHRFHR